MSTSVDVAPWEIAVASEDVEGSRPAARWSVEECGWSSQLADDVVALLAPPVVVSAESSPDPGRGPRSVAGRTGRVASAALPPAAGNPRLLVPAPPRALRGRRPSRAA